MGEQELSTVKNITRTKKHDAIDIHEKESCLHDTEHLMMKLVHYCGPFSQHAFGFLP